MTNTLLKEAKLKTGDWVTAFNSDEWMKTGDLPEGNQKLFQKAIVVGLRTDNQNRKIADIVFETGKRSNGHFLNTLKHY